jgi:hypothetical protein
MTTNYRRVVILFVVLFGFTLLAPLTVPSRSRAAAPAVVGSVHGSRNATIDGINAIPGQTVLSGDRVRVNDGAAIVSLNQSKGSQITLGPETVATFNREADEVEVRLEEGNGYLAFTHSSEDASPLRIMRGSVSISAAKGLATRGRVEVAGQTLTVAAWRGVLRVEEDGKTMDLPEGREIQLTADTAGSSPAAGKPSGQGAGKASGAELKAGGVSKAPRPAIGGDGKDWGGGDKRGHQPPPGAILCGPWASNEQTLCTCAQSDCRKKASPFWPHEPIFRHWIQCWDDHSRSATFECTCTSGTFSEGM